MPASNTVDIMEVIRQAVENASKASNGVSLARSKGNAPAKRGLNLQTDVQLPEPHEFVADFIADPANRTNRTTKQVYDGINPRYGLNDAMLRFYGFDWHQTADLLRQMETMGLVRVFKNGFYIVPADKAKNLTESGSSVKDPNIVTSERDLRLLSKYVKR